MCIRDSTVRVAVGGQKYVEFHLSLAKRLPECDLFFVAKFNANSEELFSAAQWFVVTNSADRLSDTVFRWANSHEFGWKLGRMFKPKPVGTDVISHRFEGFSRWLKVLIQWLNDEDKFTSNTDPFAPIVLRCKIRYLPQQRAKVFDCFRATERFECRLLFYHRWFHQESPINIGQKFAYYLEHSTKILSASPVKHAFKNRSLANDYDIFLQTEGGFALNLSIPKVNPNITADSQQMGKHETAASSLFPKN